MHEGGRRSCPSSGSGLSTRGHNASQHNNAVQCHLPHTADAPSTSPLPPTMTSNTANITPPSVISFVSMAKSLRVPRQPHCLQHNSSASSHTSNASNHDLPHPGAVASHFSPPLQDSHSQVLSGRHLAAGGPTTTTTTDLAVYLSSRHSFGSGLGKGPGLAPITEFSVPHSVSCGFAYTQGSWEEEHMQRMTKHPETRDASVGECPPLPLDRSGLSNDTTFSFHPPSLADISTVSRERTLGSYSSDGSSSNDDVFGGGSE